MTDKEGNSRKSLPDAGKSTSRTPLAFDPVQAALRQLHDDIVAEDIPDDFLKLLDRLDGKPRSAGR
jgi:Anti-sigma factor NepR